MIRKDFIKLAAFTGGYFATVGVTRSEKLSIMNYSNEISAADLQQFFVSLTKLKPKTVDRIIIGAPEIKNAKHKYM